MKFIFSICLAVLFSLLFSGSVQASDVPVEWRQSAGADGYKIETSVDLGATWTEIQNLTFTTFTEGTRDLAGATITVADNVLVLVRVAAYNSVGEAWKLESGAWYNSAWKPLVAPTGLGAN